MTRIVIIGAGLSGRLVALNLLRHASSTAPVAVRVIDRCSERYMGPAYSDEADYLLLNVPAARMGAFSEDPEHFLKWVQERGHHAGSWDFLARGLYRDYIFSLLSDGKRSAGNRAMLEHVCGEATDIEVTHDRATVHVAGEEPFIADSAVLALGNFPPRHPRVENRSALQSGRYVQNPWTPDILCGVARQDTVLLIGTGQTAVDLAVALHKRAHTGRIVALSRHGLLPIAHRGFEPYESFFDEIKGSRRIREVFGVVRKHLDRAQATGIDPRAVIDSLRPHTQAIWQGLPTGEKRRFLHHLFRHWEVIRSRIPLESASILDAMRASGQLQVVAGRIRNLVETRGAMEVHYDRRDTGRREVELAALVLNCVGPEADYGRIDDPLVTSLMRRGLIRPGPAHLGIDARPDGAVRGRDGVASRVLYTLGSPMKGVLWEVLAVPEIRVQAERLARLLISGRLR